MSAIAIWASPIFRNSRVGRAIIDGLSLPADNFIPSRRSHKVYADNTTAGRCWDTFSCVRADRQRWSSDVALGDVG